MNVSMPKTIDEAEAKQIALEYVKKKESDAQAEIQSVERQTYGYWKFPGRCRRKKQRALNTPM